MGTYNKLHDGDATVPGGTRDGQPQRLTQVAAELVGVRVDQRTANGNGRPAPSVGAVRRYSGDGDPWHPDAVFEAGR